MPLNYDGVLLLLIPVLQPRRTALYLLITLLIEFALCCLPVFFSIFFFKCLFVARGLIVSVYLLPLPAGGEWDPATLVSPPAIRVPERPGPPSSPALQPKREIN